MQPAFHYFLFGFDVNTVNTVKRPRRLRKQFVGSGILAVVLIHQRLKPFLNNLSYKGGEIAFAVLDLGLYVTIHLPQRNLLADVGAVRPDDLRPVDVKLPENRAA